MFEFNTVEEAVEDLKAGKIILVTDDEDRENEGDFICAAEFATTENVNFMATYGKGLICMPMSEEISKKDVYKRQLLNGLSLAYLGKNITNDILICAVERNGEVYMPNGDFVLHSGDVVSFVSERHIARDFLKQIGLATRQVKDTMIIGASKAAYYLAKELLNMGISVKIIEKEKENCESLSVKLPKACLLYTSRCV